MTVQSAPRRRLHCHIGTVMHFLQSPTDINYSNIQKITLLERLYLDIGYRSRKLKTYEVAGRSDSSPSKSKGRRKMPWATEWLGYALHYVF